jgi:hypothetical protein
MGNLERTLAYLQFVQQFELEAGMINFLTGLESLAYPWMAANLDRVNCTLEQYLRACQDCFSPSRCCDARIFAAPIAPHCPTDGFCNIRVQPATIVVDVGRIIPADWLPLVVHEYAHAMVGRAGHTPEFARIVSHLCLGLGVKSTPVNTIAEVELKSYPPCRPSPDPIGFWQGRGMC